MSFVIAACSGAVFATVARQSRHQVAASGLPPHLTRLYCLRAVSFQWHTPPLPRFGHWSSYNCLGQNCAEPCHGVLSEDVEECAKVGEPAKLVKGTLDVFSGVPLLRAINFVDLDKLEKASEEIAEVTGQQPWYTAECWRGLIFDVDQRVVDSQVQDLIKAGLPSN